MCRFDGVTKSAAQYALARPAARPLALVLRMLQSHAGVQRMSKASQHRVTRLLVVALTITGGVFLADSTVRGGLLKYKIFGMAVGGLMMLPAVVALVWRQRGLRFLRLCAFSLVPTVALLIVIESIMRVAGIGEMTVIEVVPSGRRGQGLKPGGGGADANGFRNPEVPERVDVLFVGDSQAYGSGVSGEQSFPQVYGARSGRTVYSMSLGGYGAVQYRELVRQGLSMRPHTVVVALYLGNDLMDAFLHAHLAGAADLRQEGLDYPVHDEASRRNNMPSPNLAIGFFEAIAGSSRLVSAFYAALRSQLRDVGGIWADESGAPRWVEGEIATLFTPSRRLRAVSFEEVGVADGFRITVRCLRDIAGDCQRAGANCVLLPIHTKEFCYQELLARKARPLESLAALHAAELRATTAVLEAAAQVDIEVLDPTEALVAGLADDRQLWPHGSDGHPNASGYAVIADFLVQQLAGG